MTDLYSTQLTRLSGDHNGLQQRASFAALGDELVNSTCEHVLSPGREREPQPVSHVDACALAQVFEAVPRRG